MNRMHFQVWVDRKPLCTSAVACIRWACVYISMEPVSDTWLHLLSPKHRKDWGHNFTYIIDGMPVVLSALRHWHPLTFCATNCKWILNKHPQFGNRGYHIHNADCRHAGENTNVLTQWTVLCIAISGLCALSRARVPIEAASAPGLTTTTTCHGTATPVWPGAPVCRDCVKHYILMSQCSL